MDIVSVPGSQFSDISAHYSVTELAQIGKRLGEATRLRIADVYITSLEGIRTRRPEVTLVRDLEFLRIQDTKSGKVTASYPDSTQWFHLCPPHCLLIKQNDGRIRRLMWHAVASHLPLEKNTSEHVASAALVERNIADGKWLRCITDYVEHDGSNLPEVRQAKSVETIGNVACLESILLNGKTFLLALYKNGMLAAYTEDLNTANSPLADTMIGETVEFMTTIDSRRATDGILRSVRNVHPTLDGSRLLVIISRPAGVNTTHQIRIRILQLSIRPSNPDRPIATTLFSQDITIDPSFRHEFDCMAHDKGQLYVWGRKTVQIFDLSEDPNRPYRTLRFEDYITSVLRLDQRTMAVCTTSTFDQINLEYSTSQGSFSWPEPLRQSEITKQYESGLISYDRKSGRLLCLYGSKIIAINSNGKNPTTIADFIDRGLNQTNMTAQYQSAAYQAHLAKNLRGDVKWEEWISHVVSLSNCVQENNTIEFDTIFVKLLEFITSSTVSGQLDNVGLSPSQYLNNDEKLSVVMSLIFEPVFELKDENRTFGVKIKILPRKTFNWLVRSNCVTSSKIEHSFRRLGKMSLESIKEEALVSALATYDTSLSTLQYFVTHSDSLTAVEASCAISSAMGSQLESTLIAPLGITSGNEMDVDEAPTERRVMSESDQQTNRIMDDGRSALTKIALIRLIDKDHPTIIKALRQQLTNQQLFFLIEYLRTEMSRQGWFVEVLHESAYTGVDGNEQHTITRLAKILGCVLDALGMAPWLNTATSIENENLLAWMKLEISAALEAVEEAAYMSGILHEVSLFTKLLNFPERDRSQQGSRRIEPKLVDDGLLGNNALPPSLKPAGYIDINVVRAGKVEKMSSRQIGHMKSKMVGAYSREKIDLNDFYQPPMNHQEK